MKILSLIVNLCLLFVSDLTSTENAQNDSGMVYGYVFNSSLGSASSYEAKPFPGSSGVAGQEVVLHIYIDGQSAEGARPHSVTDANGRFEFKSLAIGKRFAYYPVSVFQGIEYYGEVVVLTPDSVQKRSDLSLFGTTQSDSTIFVAMHHIILKPAIGSLNVREVILFANRGRHTFVGDVPAGPPGKNIVLRADVPDGATQVQFGGELMSCCAVVNDNHIFDTMEFKPGMRQVVINYLLPYEGKEASLSKKLTHPTDNVDLFLPEGAGTVHAPGFASRPLFKIREQNYQRFSAANLGAGSILTLSVTDLASAPRDLRWVAPAALAVLIFALFGIHWWRKSSQSSDEPPEQSLGNGLIDRKRRLLLNEILRLDAAFEAGALDEPTYSTTRERLKHLVLELDSKRDDSSLHQPEKKGDSDENR